MSQPGFLSRVVLDNYKSVRSCDVSLPRLAFLVGANGAGKSNFLDSLAFVADSLRFSLAHALLVRGGLGEVQGRFGTRPGGFGMRIEGRLPDATVRYAFAIRPTRSGGLEVQREDCVVAPDKPGKKAKFYSIRKGCVAETNIAQPPVVARDQLYLVRAAAIEAFRPVYDALASIRVYNLKPDALREPQLPATDPILKRDGSNVAQVLASLEQRDPWFKERIEAYLAVIAPGTVGVDLRAEAARPQWSSGRLLKAPIVVRDLLPPACRLEPFERWASLWLSSSVPATLARDRACLASKSRNWRCIRTPLKRSPTFSTRPQCIPRSWRPATAAICWIAWIFRQHRSSSSPTTEDRRGSARWERPIAGRSANEPSRQAS